MFENMPEQEARKVILQQVREYCKKYHNKKKWEDGDRIPMHPGCMTVRKW